MRDFDASGFLVTVLAVVAGMFLFRMVDKNLLGA